MGVEAVNAVIANRIGRGRILSSYEHFNANKKVNESFYRRPRQIPF
jgi:hypothetical protein